MAEILEQIEADPSSYPDAPSGLSAAAAALEPIMIWQRIEHYVAHRWTPREVVWVVDAEAGDEWKPPLAPLVSFTSEIWPDGTWEARTLAEFPEGIMLPADARYRITATVGGGTAPLSVMEPFRRFAEYVADQSTQSPASTSEQYTVGPVTMAFQRPANWIARGLQNSGAADLLRKYRRV